jgi:hypothetical protein
VRDLSSTGASYAAASGPAGTGVGCLVTIEFGCTGSVIGGTVGVLGGYVTGAGDVSAAYLSSYFGG